VDWITMLAGLDDVEAASAATAEDLWPWDETGWKSLDVTSLTQEWASGHAANLGVLVMAENEDVDGCDMRIWSRNSADASQHPVLEIVYEM